MSIVMGGPAPRRLFAEEPDAVGRFCQETVIESGSCGNSDATQTFLSGKNQGFVIGSISVVEKPSPGAGEWYRPGCVEVGFGSHCEI